MFYHIALLVGDVLNCYRLLKLFPAGVEGALAWYLFFEDMFIPHVYLHIFLTNPPSYLCRCICQL